MTDHDNVTNTLIYATLQDVQERLAEMDSRLTNGIQINSGKLSAIENILAGFHQSLSIRDQEIDTHRGRIEALEDAVKDLKGEDPQP